MNRREFIGAAVAMATGMGATPPAKAGEVPRRKLGRTGEEVSIVGLGGAHIGGLDAAEAVGLVRAAVDAGITFLDNSWDYQGGDAERHMGRALKDGYRRRAFLMTKLDGRERRSAAKQIDESLSRLQTDHVDLLQFHEIIRPSDPERIFAPGGAMEALLAARKAGKTRFVGFTGHKSPEIHLAMLKAWEAAGSLPDAVQMPINVLDASHDSFQARVLPELVKRGVGVLGMKSLLGDGSIRKSGVAPPDALRYAMSVPGVTVTITGIDSREILDQALGIARGFQPLAAAERRRLEERAAAAAAGGKLERYKTTHAFDATHFHPEWL